LPNQSNKTRDDEFDITLRGEYCFVMGSDIKRRDGGESLATNLPAVDFSSVLARTIESIRDDPAQLRNAVYELARIKLQREVWQRTPPMSILETRRLMLALETAIERVETSSSQQEDLELLQSAAQLLENSSPNPGRSAGWGPAPPMTERDPIVIIDQTAIYRDVTPPYPVAPADDIARILARDWIASRSGSPARRNEGIEPAAM
jgi:hypothetical protein